MRTFKPGERVLVLKKVPSYYRGWNNSWQSDMDKSIGKVLTVIEDRGKEGVQLNEKLRYSYPRFCLRLVKPVHTKVIAATLVVHHVSKMTKQGRLNLARWLEEQARTLVNEGENYGKVVRISYRYVPKGRKTS